MKLQKLQISNILCFKYYEDINKCHPINFNEELNILIGANGSGKTTVLEVVNFLFKKVIFLNFIVYKNLLGKKDNKPEQKKRAIVNNSDIEHIPFRLAKNYSAERKESKIKCCIELDDIDKKNINILIKNTEKLKAIGKTYSNYEFKFPTKLPSEKEMFWIEVDLCEDTFEFCGENNSDNEVFSYFQNYYGYKILIETYNLEHPEDKIENLYETLTMISGYRNYNSFVEGVKIGENSGDKQIQEIYDKEYKESISSSENKEPKIFNLVQLYLAKKHKSLTDKKIDKKECEDEINNDEVLVKINEKLKLINLKCIIKCITNDTWSYSFEFFNLSPNEEMPLTNINILSAGEKAIIHLIFEAYGRGVKGGLVIVDEPELHLHYQFQHEYLKIIEEINKEQKCQYILVTHSESFINSKTIESVIRLSLNEKKESVIHQPKKEEMTKENKWLVKILDNTRSTHVFFSNKVLLVEGESDRYFFQEVINFYGLEISVVYVEGKKWVDWKKFFRSWGLEVFIISDFDFLYSEYYSEQYKEDQKANGKKANKIKTRCKVLKFKLEHRDANKKIKELYKENIFILKQGPLEIYLNIEEKDKGLESVIEFCKGLKGFLLKSNSKSKELKTIFELITCRKLDKKMCFRT